MSKTTMSSRFSFDAAHRLPRHEGKCANLHGHRWVFEVEIEGKINKNTGMIYDFSLLKRLVDEKIGNFLDHSYLNDNFDNPTAENLVEWIAKAIKASLPNHLFLVSVTLWETPDNKVKWITTKEFSEWKKII